MTKNELAFRLGLVTGKLEKIIESCEDQNTHQVTTPTTKFIGGGFYGFTAKRHWPVSRCALFYFLNFGIL